MSGVITYAVAVVIMLVVGVLFWWFMLRGSAAPPTPNAAGGIPLPGGTGAPSAGSGTDVVVVSASDLTASRDINASRDITASRDLTETTTSAATTSAPATSIPFYADNAVSAAPITPVSDIKMLILYEGPNFEGRSSMRAAGSKTQLADYVDGKYEFRFKSFKIDPGAKLMFSRTSATGERRSFAVGQYNVADIEPWIRGYDKLSGDGVNGFGSIGINDLDLRYPTPIFISLLNDASWNAAIVKEQVECANTLIAWNYNAPGKFSPSDCSAIFAGTYEAVRT